MHKNSTVTQTIHGDEMQNIELDLSFIFYRRKINSYSLKKVSEGTGINVKRLRRAEKENRIDLADLLKLAVFFDVNEKELYKYKIVKHSIKT